ncbi:MAG: MmcQ/YjbR family DNA-binding protein [Pseudomonadota bacterium]
MLGRADFNDYCGSLTASTHVVQWGGADVWKVGGKVFAIGGWKDGRDAYTFKVTPLGFEVLSDAPSIRPAPYMASRGLLWVQVYDFPGLSKEELKEHLLASYDMVRAKLTRKKRLELGL